MPTECTTCRGTVIGHGWFTCNIQADRRSLPKEESALKDCFGVTGKVIFHACDLTMLPR